MGGVAGTAESELVWRRERRLTQVDIRPVRHGEAGLALVDRAVVRL